MMRPSQSLLVVLACFGLALPASACADISRDEPLVDILFDRNVVSQAVPSGGQDTPPAPDPAEPAVAATGLPPQTLESGNCGAFFWDRADPNPLIVFENESRGEASMWLDGEIYRTVTPVRPFAYQTGQSLNRTYAAGDQNVTVNGTITEVRGSEAIVGRALMRQQQADGAEIVRPVLGLISCRE